MPPDQFYRSGHDQDTAEVGGGYDRRPRPDGRSQDESHDLRERTLPEEFDDDDEDDCISREAAGEEKVSANLRLKNSEVNKFFEMNLPGQTGPTRQVPFHLDESRIPAHGSFVVPPEYPNQYKAPLQ